MPDKSSPKIPVSSKSDGDAPRSGEKKIAASKFELIAELGRGGMATVYLARTKRRGLASLIVLKQLRADLAENSDFLAMFLEEARLAGKLQHPNIVETYEVGLDDGKYYIAMEFLDGLSLQAVLTKFGWTGKLSFALQVHILIEALRALERAYTQADDDGLPLKIVHRDVSPPNIIVTFDGAVKLVDFGIAKAASSTVETRTGLIKGKLTYMAPEQAASGDVDSRTDIYSVGVMLWQAAAGKRRWKGIENTDVLKRLHEGKVTDSPNATANGLPKLVDAIVLKAIGAEPEDRYSSASEFRIALEGLLREMKLTVTTADLAAFMTREFSSERERAQALIGARLAELDGARAPEEHESLTAIRVSPAVEARAKSPRKVPIVEENRPISDREVTKPSAPTPSAKEISATKLSPQAPRPRSLAIIGIVGFALAAALAYLAIRNMHASSPDPKPTAPVATTSAAIADPPSVPSPTTSAVTQAPPVATSSDATPAIASTQPLHGRGTHRVQAPPSPAPTQAAIAPVAVATPPPSPATPAANPASTDAPSLDKQDPWKSNRPTTDKADPWAK